LITAAVLAAGGCSKNPVSPAGSNLPVFGPSDSVFTDGQLRAAAYTVYAGPAGFYSERRPNNYEWPHYLELSTEDTTQARAWVVASAATNSDYPNVDSASPTMTQRYFEFVTYKGGSAARQPVRIDRASYLDRTGFAGSFRGKLVVRPIDNAAVRGVAEYLWYVDHPDDLSDIKPLSSFSRMSDGSIRHSIYFVHRTEGLGLFGPYPVVELIRDDYWIDTSTGAILWYESNVRDISG
jgi:hypothetical protein